MPIHAQITLGLIKPDAVYSGWTPLILDFYAERGLVPNERYRMRFSRDQARRFYAEHSGKFFFNGLVLGMSSGSLEALMFVGADVIKRLRDVNGATDPQKAMPSTVRRDFLSAGGVFNTVHGSANREDARREVDLVRMWARERGIKSLVG